MNNKFFYIVLISAAFMTQPASCMEENIEEQINNLQVEINRISFMIGGKKQELSQVQRIQNNSYLFQQNFSTSGYSSYDEYSKSLAAQEKALKNTIRGYHIRQQLLEKDVEKLERKIDKMQTPPSTIKSKKI